jgi:hypothetical protein
MNTEDLIEEVIRLKANVENIEKNVDTLIGKVDDIKTDILEARNHCAVSCAGIFVSRETFTEAIGPLKTYVYGTLVTVIGSIVITLLTRH